MESPERLTLGTLTADLQALRQELGALRADLRKLHATVEQAVEQLAAAQEPRAFSAPAPSALLARRNAERLNAEVMRRSARGVEPGSDTELDLLIDRLHELSEGPP